VAAKTNITWKQRKQGTAEAERHASMEDEKQEKRPDLQTQSGKRGKKMACTDRKVGSGKPWDIVAHRFEQLVAVEEGKRPWKPEKRNREPRISAMLRRLQPN